MTFEIRMQRKQVLATAEQLRDDAYLQAVASEVRAIYMKKQIPTTPAVVRAALEKVYPSVDQQQGIEYHQYTNPVTGDKYWCCVFSTTLTIDPQGQTNPVVVQLREISLVP